MMVILRLVVAVILLHPAISFAEQKELTSFGETDVWKNYICCDWKRKPIPISVNDNDVYEIRIESKDSEIIVNGQQRPAVIIDLPKYNNRVLSIKAFAGEGMMVKDYFHPVLVEVGEDGNMIRILDNETVTFGSPRFKNSHFNEFAKYYISDKTASLIMFGKSLAERKSQNIQAARKVEYYDGKGGDPKVKYYNKRSMEIGLTLEGEVKLWLSKW